MNRLRNLSFILLGLAAWIAIVVLTPSESREAKPAPPVPGGSAMRERRATPREKQPVMAATAPGGEADSARREEAQDEIHAAVVTYSPEGVKAIRPWLLDGDPEIRAAARDGMVQLGEPDGVPVLRDAATKLGDPAEIAAFQEAADLLALPAWSETTEAREVIAEIIEGNSP